jgi:hypothetical protein
VIVEKIADRQLRLTREHLDGMADRFADVFERAVALGEEQDIGLAIACAQGHRISWN